MAARVPAQERHFLGFIGDALKVAVGAVEGGLKGLGIIPPNTTSLKVTPVTSGPSSPAAATPGTAGMPSWLVPVLVGVGVLLIVLLVSRRS